MYSESHGLTVPLDYSYSVIIRRRFRQAGEWEDTSTKTVYVGETED